MCIGHLYLMELLPFGLLGDRSWFVLLVLRDLVVPFWPRCPGDLTAIVPRMDSQIMDRGSFADSNSLVSTNEERIGDYPTTYSGYLSKTRVCKSAWTDAE
jgi:hypothetical protein